MSFNTKISFNPTPVEIIIIQCDGKLNLQRLTTKGVTDKIRDQQLQQLNEDYQKFYREHPPKLDDLISDIKRYKTQILNIKSLISTENEKTSLINLIATKIVELVKIRKEEEKDFSFFKKFFHRLGHLFRFHGFNTTAEWAEKVRDELFDPRVMESYLNPDTINVINFDRVPSLDTVKQVLPQLSSAQIKKLFASASGNLKDNVNLASLILSLKTDAQQKAALEGILEQDSGLIILTKMFAYSSDAEYEELKQKIIPILPEKLSQKIRDLCSQKYDENAIKELRFYFNKTQESRPAFKQYIAEKIAHQFASQNDIKGFIQFFDKNPLRLQHSILAVVEGRQKPLLLSDKSIESIKETIDFNQINFTSGKMTAEEF